VLQEATRPISEFIAAHYDPRVDDNPQLPEQPGPLLFEWRERAWRNAEELRFIRAASGTGPGCIGQARRDPGRGAGGEQLAQDASTVPWGHRQAGRGEVLTRIARLLAGIGLCRQLLLDSAPQPAVASWTQPEDEPIRPFDPGLVEDLGLVARVLRDRAPSV
jgi:hypothetical protein